MLASVYSDRFKSLIPSRLQTSPLSRPLSALALACVFTDERGPSINVRLSESPENKVTLYIHVIIITITNIHTLTHAQIESKVVDADDVGDQYHNINFDSNSRQPTFAFLPI